MKIGRWTPEDETFLRENYTKLGAPECARQLGRVLGAVFHKAERLRVRRRARWTTKEMQLLRVHWGQVSLDEVAKLVGRPPLSVYQMASVHGLTHGAPQGMEIFTHAAKRLGIAPASLRRILRWAGVSLRRPPTRTPSKDRAGRFFVDSSDVDDAFLRWNETEDLHQVAVRLGWSDIVVRRLLLKARAAGDERIPAPPKHGFRWRIPIAVAKELVAKHESGETLAVAAQRVGVGVATLSRWLIAAGERVPHRTVARVDPAVVDDVVAAKKRTGTRAWGPRSAA